MGDLALRFKLSKYVSDLPCIMLCLICSCFNSKDISYGDLSDAEGHQQDTSNNDSWPQHPPAFILFAFHGEPYAEAEWNNHYEESASYQQCFHGNLLIIMSVSTLWLGSKGGVSDDGIGNLV